MNRGIAKRTLFEGPADVRYFLSRLARAVRAGGIEVHAYCVMTTHFHLLLRSAGCLSEVMRQVQLDYVRRFNRSRRRDGPLVRGRFLSKPVRSLAYRRVLVRYIDANPVRAGMCSRAAEYPFGSAEKYSRASGPRWLERSWVEAQVLSSSGKERYEPGDYSTAFGASSAADAGLVEARAGSPGTADHVDDLLGSTPSGVLSWMRWKTRLADGTEPGLPIAAADCVDAVIRRARAQGAELLLRSPRSDLLGEIHAGLLRGLTGAGLAEIAQRIGQSTSSSSRLCGRFAARLGTDEAYAQHASRLCRAALEEQYGIASAVHPSLVHGSGKN